MPTYCYVCKNCGAQSEIVRSVRDCNEPVTCSCGGEVVRDYNAERANIGDREYRRPIVSQSLAINPEQIQEHRQKFPEIKVLPDGRPVFESYRQHDSYLKKIGVVKNRQRTRRRGTKVATARKAS